MTITCAWCGEIQGFKPPLDDYRTSHTICPKCRKAVLGQSERHLTQQAECTAIDLEGDIFAQMVDITRRDAERILQEKGDRP